MPGDSHRHVEGDRDEPRHRHQDLDGSDDDDRHLQRRRCRGREQLHEWPREREVQAPRRLAEQRPFESAQRQDAHQDDEDRPLDVVALPHRRPGESRLASGPRRQAQQPHRDQRHHRHECRDGDQFHGELVRPPVTDQRQREFGIEQLPIRRNECEEQRPERDHHEPVRSADGSPLQHPGMPKRFRQHRLGACASRTAAPECRLTQPNDADHAYDGARHQRYANDGDGEADDDRRDLNSPHRSAVLLVRSAKQVHYLRVDVAY